MSRTRRQVQLVREIDYERRGGKRVEHTAWSVADADGEPLYVGLFDSTESARQWVGRRGWTLPIVAELVA